MANVNLKDEDGRAPLHTCKGAEETQRLVGLGADINITDEVDWTPLMCAASSGDYEKVRVLLSHPQINVNATNSSGVTALHYAASKGHNEILTALVSRDDINLNIQDRHARNTPLMRAISCRQDLCVRRLIQAGARLNLRDVEGNTALHYTVMAGNSDLSVLLVQKGANVDLKNAEEQTPLDLAHPSLRMMLEEEMQEGQQQELIDLLLQLGGI